MRCGGRDERNYGEGKEGCKKEWGGKGGMEEIMGRVRRVVRKSREGKEGCKKNWEGKKRCKKKLGG